MKNKLIQDFIYYELEIKNFKIEGYKCIDTNRYLAYGKIDDEHREIPFELLDLINFTYEHTQKIFIPKNATDIQKMFRWDTLE